MQRSLCLVAIATVLGCSSPEAAAFDAERPWRQPGDVIDSILPMEEHERRFREGLPEVTAFTGGAPDREALARQVLDAVSRRDSLALATMTVSRSEFAWLVFPHHVYRVAPYELDPAIFWLQIQASSAKGLARLLERHGGTPLRLQEMRCEPDTLQLVDRSMTMWTPCQLEYQAGDSLLTRQLFGSVIERDGNYKLLSYANDF